MAFNARRAPNVSEYIANLNALPTEQELQAQSDFKFDDDDLSMFTNANFFDFDLGQTAADIDASAVALGVAEDAAQTSAAPAPAAAVIGATKETDIKGLNFSEFNFGDFNTYTHPSKPVAHLPSINTTSTYPTSSSAASPTSGLLSPSSEQFGLKRKAESITSSDNIEESSRAAAEEDKRRRNTAASARFRVKKKQREQALEKSAKEMSDKVAALEGRINQLETENKWLKNLITEKNVGPQKEDLSKAWTRYSGEHAREASERITEERKDGVGTMA